MKIKHFLLAFSLTLLFLTPSMAQEAQELPDLNEAIPADEQVRTGVLENGLTYIIRKNTEPQNRAALRLVVNAGSVLEDDDQQGLAHFVEHMAFNGTKNFKKSELVDYLEGIGMRFGPDLNAYTSFDETVYMLLVPTDSAEIVSTAFQILEDWAHNISFEDEEIDKERGVVIEEWRLGQGASERMRDKQFPILFKDSHYADRLPIGKKEILESFDYDTARRFYKTWYRPDLMSIVAVGDFDVDEIENTIKTHFSGIQNPENEAERVLFPIPDHAEPLVAIATDPEASGTQISVYFKQAPKVLAQVSDLRQQFVGRLYNGMLNNRLQELTQKAEPPFIFGQSGQGSFLRTKDVYFLGAGVSDTGIEKGLAALLIEAARVRQHGFTASELERQKINLLRGYQQAYQEREKTHSNRYAGEYVNEFLTGEPSPGIAYEFMQAQRMVVGITLEEVNHLASEWITDENRVVMLNAPEKDGLEIPTEEALLAVFDAVKSMEIEAYEDAVVAEALIENLPPAGTIATENMDEATGAIRWTLSNGIKVTFKQTDFKEDEVLISGWSPGGSSLAKDEAYFSSSFATTLVSQGGLGEFSQTDLRKMMTGKVANAGTYISTFEEGVSGSASPQDLETMFQLLYLRMVAPRTDEAVVAGLLNRYKAAVQNRSADPRVAFSDTLSTTLAQNHYRARPISVDLLDEANLADAMAFYQERFADAGDYQFYIVGNTTAETLRPFLVQYLAILPNINREETWADEGIRRPAGIVKKTVVAGTEPQSMVSLTFHGDFEWNGENRLALGAMRDVLNIKLREVLREDMGGVYGVRVSARPQLKPIEQYSISISFGCDPARADELIAAVFEQIELMKTTLATDEYLGKVTEIRRRDHETSVRTNSFWLTGMEVQDKRVEPLGDLLSVEESIAKINAEMIQAAAKLYFNVDQYVQVVLVPETTE